MWILRSVTFVDKICVHVVLILTDLDSTIKDFFVTNVDLHRERISYSKVILEENTRAKNIFIT